MKKDVYILAIETSCDETSMAIIKNGTDNIKTTILTQMDTIWRSSTRNCQSHALRKHYNGF